MDVTASAEQEIVDFIASGTTPDSILSFRPSIEAAQRLEDLIDREKDGVITADEKSELDHCLHLEHLMRMAKAKARLILARG